MIKLSQASTRSVSRLACLAPLLFLAMPTVAGCTGSNPLIGNWKFSNTNNKFGAAGCSSTFVFTAKSATITNPPTKVIPQGSVSTMAVTYVTASPTLVAVMTNAAGHVNYNFTDRNHMYTEDAWGKCNYERAK